MSLETIQVVGPIYLADGQPAANHKMVFDLSDSDVDHSAVLSHKVEVVLGETAELDIALWKNSRGIGGTFYRVAVIPPPPVDRTQISRYSLSLPDDAGPVNFHDYVNVGAPPPVSQALGAVSDAVAAAALSQSWATKTDGEVEPGFVSSKQSAIDAAAEVLAAKAWASGAGEIEPNLKSSKGYSEDSQAILSSILDIFDQFVDRYMGEFTSHPTQEEDGDPLEPGASYFNPTEGDYGVTYIWTGSQWVSQTLIVQALRDEVIATKGEIQQLVVDAQAAAASVDIQTGTWDPDFQDTAGNSIFSSSDFGGPHHFVRNGNLVTVTIGMRSTGGFIVADDGRRVVIGNLPFRVDAPVGQPLGTVVNFDGAGNAPTTILNFGADVGVHYLGLNAGTGTGDHLTLNDLQDAGSRNVLFATVTYYTEEL